MDKYQIKAYREKIREISPGIVDLWEAKGYIFRDKDKKENVDS